MEVIEKYLKRDAGTKSMSIPSDFAKFSFELGRMENENLKIHKREVSDDDSHVDSADVELLFPEDQAFAKNSPTIINKDKNKEEKKISDAL